MQPQTATGVQGNSAPAAHSASPVTPSASSSGSGISDGMTIQQVMDSLGCQRQEVKQAGANNPLTEGSGMTYVATCWFPYDNDTGGSPIIVYTFRTSEDVTRWVSNGCYHPFAFNSDPDHPGAYVIHAANWAAILQSGDKNVAWAIAGKIGTEQVTFSQGSGDRPSVCWAA